MLSHLYYITYLEGSFCFTKYSKSTHFVIYMSSNLFCQSATPEQVKKLEQLLEKIFHILQCKSTRIFLISKCLCLKSVTCKWKAWICVLHCYILNNYLYSLYLYWFELLDIILVHLNSPWLVYLSSTYYFYHSYYR